jgi:hypothetical protein
MFFTPYVLIKPILLDHISTRISAILRTYENSSNVSLGCLMSRWTDDVSMDKELILINDCVSLLSQLAF